jgi:3-oxosteroid 1-dehydrogenase
VVVLEKAPVVGGTTAVSGGSAWIPCNHHMPDEGVEDSADEALTYLRACAGDQGDDAHLVALVERGAEMIGFLERRAGIPFWAWPGTGGAVDYRPWLPGAKPGARPLDVEPFRIDDLAGWAPRLRLTEQRPRWAYKHEYYRRHLHVLPPEPVEPPPAGVYNSGVALVARLLQACLRVGVEVRTEAPVRELTIEDGRVTGVLADGHGSVRAGAVLLATGGYSHNPELKRTWLSRPLEASCEVESNTGDGHLIGLAAGAAVAGLGDAWWMPQVPVGPGAWAGSREDRCTPHSLIVNQRARRFMNEAMNYYDAAEPLGLKTGGAPRNHPAWLIFDAQARAKYSVIAGKFPGGEVPEWIVQAPSLEALAARLELDPAALSATVERFNGFARAGDDSDFGRGANRWDVAWGDPEQRPNAALGTVERPPFYAQALIPGALATRGGLRVDAQAHVLAARDGAPIPGLYAAGNCSNGATAGAYPGPGATIGAAMTFGYLAGTAVAAAATPRQRALPSLTS